MSATPHAEASHAARFGGRRGSSVGSGIGEHISKEEKKKDFDKLNAVADRMERDNLMFLKSSRQELDAWRKLDRNGNGRTNMSELRTYIEATYPDLEVGAQRTFLPGHPIAERVTKVVFRAFGKDYKTELSRETYPEILYSCPIVLRALLLFDHLDSNDDYSLTEKEFEVICLEFNKRNMFIDKMNLDIPKDGSAQTNEENRLKAAFMTIYRQVDGDGNDKINFEEFAKWIVTSITGFDEFFQSFVSLKARSEKPPLYLEETGPEHEPISPTKKRGAGVAGIKLPPSAARASAPAGSKAGPLSPRNFTGTRPETLQDKFNNLKRTASGLVRFDQKSSETPVQTKKERMEEAIRLLNDKERNLASQYFSTIDRNNDGFLSKLELQDFIVNKLGYKDEKEYVEDKIEEADVDCPSSLEEKTIDLHEFMFGFQFLFKSKDVHLPQYLLASALWSKFLERAVEFEAIGLNTDFFKKAEVKKLKAQCAQFFGHVSKKSGSDFCCLLNWGALVQRAAALSSTDGELDDAMKGVKADDRKPYQRGVVDNVLQDLRALLNFRSSSEDEMKSRIAGLSSGTISVDDEVVMEILVQKSIFEEEAIKQFQKHLDTVFSFCNIPGPNDVITALQSTVSPGTWITKFLEILLIEALIDNLSSACVDHMLTKNLTLQKEGANVKEARKLFDLPDNQFPASTDGFMFPCTLDRATLGRLYVFADYICFIETTLLGKTPGKFKVFFEDVTSVQLTSPLGLDFGIEIGFQPTDNSLNLAEKPAPLKSPLQLKTFSWDLLDRQSFDIWQKLPFFTKIDLAYNRDLAHTILSSRLIDLGKIKPVASISPAFSFSEIENYRYMFELSHKMIVTLVDQDSGGVFEAFTSMLFKSKTQKKLLVMEQCDRCHKLLSTPTSQSPDTSPVVRLVMYDLRTTDEVSWKYQEGDDVKFVYKFDYKSTRTSKSADGKWEDTIDFKTRRVIGNSSDLALDIRASSNAPGGFDMVFKSKSSSTTVLCAETADLQSATPESSRDQTIRALHTFELIATACLAGNPDILSSDAHRLLCRKVLASSRPHNLAVSANNQLRYVFNAPWQLENVWQPPTFKLSVFFSSTFTDTKRERRIIMESILPELSQRGRKEGVQCVFTDMRWGVVDQNTLDQDTWEVCDREIRRSERESCDIFFVSLQSAKYGYMPLPKCLPSSVAHSVSKIADEHVRKLFHTWYKQDLNDVPEAKFHLQSISNIDDKPYWSVALPVLREYLSGIAFDESAGLLVGRSVTEWEFLRASQIGSRDRMFWFKREFEFEQDDEGKYWKDKWCKGKPNASFFCDGSENGKLDSLWRTMHSVLGPNFRHYCPKYSKEYIDEHGREIDSSPLSTDFAKDCQQLLTDALERVISQKNRWSVRAGGLIPNFQNPIFQESYCSRNAEMISEMLFHSETARRICKTFWHGPSVDPNGISLEALAQKIVNLVRQDIDITNTARSENTSPVIALVGPPCSGKTAVMARVYGGSHTHCHVVDLDISHRSTTIIRFIGNSDSSTNLDAFDPMVLITGICEQILTTRCSDDDGHAKYFRQRLDQADAYANVCSLLIEMVLQFNVRIILDGLDELENRFYARTLLQFISEERPRGKNDPNAKNIYAPWSRFVVSCSADHTLADTKTRGASSRLESIGAHILMLPEFTFDDVQTAREPQLQAVSFIEHVLKHQRRRLQPFQLEHIRNHVSTMTLSRLHDPPLYDLTPSSASYVNILALQAQRISNLDMKPFSDISRWGGSFKDLLFHCLFNSAEQNFGSKFVKGALFCVTSCKCGISDTELVDVLSQHQGILDEVNKYVQYQASRQISMHVWMKFKTFLNERCNDVFIQQRSCSCWNSQQIRRIAEFRYSINTENAADKAMFFDLHQVLAVYFGWRINFSKKLEVGSAAHVPVSPVVPKLGQCVLDASGNLCVFSQSTGVAPGFFYAAKLPVVYGHQNDVVAWFPEKSLSINSRRFQECSFHLLMAATQRSEVSGDVDANAFILYKLAYDELFSVTTIFCCCILGLADDLLGRMEDFKHSLLFKLLSPQEQDRALQYLLYFSSNFQSIVLNPRRELLATATETFVPATSGFTNHCVRSDAFTFVRNFFSSKGDNIVVNDSHQDNSPKFSEKSFAFLNRLFSPPIAEPMQWPPTLPERQISAIAISPCSQYIVCLDGSVAQSPGGSLLRGKSQLKILRGRFGEAEFDEKLIEVDPSHSHFSKHVVLFPIGGQPEPMLACAVGPKIYIYDVFRADGHEVPHLRFIQPPGSSSITCLAFSSSGLYFCIGCADGQVSVVDTWPVNPSIAIGTNTIDACFLKTPGVSLNYITAVAFGGQDKDCDRIIVGDRSGHLVVSTPLPFANNLPSDTAAKSAKSLFLSPVFRIQWACSPSLSTSVRCVALFCAGKALYAAGSWKSDHRHDSELKFFALTQETKAALQENIVIEKATVAFPATVPFFAVLAPLSSLHDPSVLTVCDDGNIRSLDLHKCLGKPKRIPVDGVNQAEDGGATASDDSLNIVFYQAGVGSGVQVCASSTFANTSQLAIALSNKMCKFLKIPEMPQSSSSSSSESFGQGWSLAAAIDFIPPAASRSLYMLAFISNHPRPNSVSFTSALGFTVAGQCGVCCSNQLYEKLLSAFCMSPCGRIMITSGKGRKEGAERAIWIERMSFWTGGSVDSDTPAKWIQQHYVTSLDCTTKFNPGSEHTGLVAALASILLPASWPQKSEGMFFLASASPDENDNATEDVKKYNNRGVVKLRLISPSSFFNSPVDEAAKKRASCVVCSLICSRDLAGGLTKSLTLNMCVEAEAVYIVSSISGGFAAWCINSDDFSSMLKGDSKAIPAFKHYSVTSSTRHAHRSCIVRSGHRHPPPFPSSPLTSNKAFVVCGHPDDWTISVTDLTSPGSRSKAVKPIHVIQLRKAVDAIREWDSSEQTPRIHVAAMPCFIQGVKFVFSVSLPNHGCVCGVLILKPSSDYDFTTKDGIVIYITSVQNVHTVVMLHAFIIVLDLPDPLHMLPLNAHLEIKALTASPDGACVAAVMTDGSVVNWTAAELETSTGDS